MAARRDRFGRFVKRGQKLPPPRRTKSGKFASGPVARVRPVEIAASLLDTISEEYSVASVAHREGETYPRGWMWHTYRVEFYEVIGVEFAGHVARLAWPAVEGHYHRQARTRIEVADVRKGEIVGEHYFTLTNTDHTRAAFWQVENAVKDMNRDVSGQYTVLVAIEFELRA